MLLQRRRYTCATTREHCSNGYREPNFSDWEEDIENTRQEVRDCLNKFQQSELMRLVDTREETSLASFTAGFKLAWELSKELEADGLYSLDEEETACVCRRIGKEDGSYE